MKQSPTRLALVLLFVFIGCFGTAYAAAGMLTALPAPQAGGTCGPSTGSETAAEALTEPGSIGAGPEPPASNATGHQQWKMFTEECQSMADRRGLASLAIFVISVAVASIGLIFVFRRTRSDSDDEDTVDGSSGWPAMSGPGGSAQLVGVGAPLAGTWSDPAAPVAYAGPPPVWTAGPTGPPPNPYGAPPPYPGQGGYPSAPPYPPQPPPAPAPSYPAYPPQPGYPPPAYPAYPAQPAPPPPPPEPLAPHTGPDSIQPTPTSGAADEPPTPPS
jgi:hypothetical protein